MSVGLPLLTDRIDWQSNDTHALLNHRLPKEEQERLFSVFPSLPPLRGHVWMATSGSTGRFKWVALSKKALLASAEAVNRHIKSDSSDVWFRPLPTFHVGGLGIMARAHLTGARVVEAQARFKKWNVVLFAQLIEESEATLVSLVPTQVFDLVRNEIPCPPAVRVTVIGGAALSPELYARARELGWPLLPSYGFTECCSQVATATLESLKDTAYPELKLLSHVEARTRRPDGKIEVSSPSLLTGIAIDHGRFFEFEDPKVDGWYVPGDLGEVLDRVIRVQGRESSYVKIGGEGVDLNRIQALFEEAQLESKLGFDAAMVAVPDPRLGHVLVLAYAPGAEESRVKALEAAYNRRVLPLERARGAFAVEIPRSPLGKLLVGELGQRLEPLRRKN